MRPGVNRILNLSFAPPATARLAAHLARPTAPATHLSAQPLNPPTITS